MKYAPMLAQNIDPRLLIEFADKRNFVFQQKVDGVRVMAVLENNNLAFLNRRGEPAFVNVHEKIESELLRLKVDVVLDGEMVGNVLWLFDIASVGDHPYNDRYETLEKLMKLWKPNTRHIKLLPVAKTRLSKLKLTDAVMKGNGEGIIVRDREAKYKQGVRASCLLKAKFYKEAEFIATALGINGKDNIGLGLIDDRGEVIDMGEVSALVADGPNVKIGNVITVRYLYVTKDNRVYQPNMPRIRKDKKRNECTFDQLRYVDKRVVAKW